MDIKNYSSDSRAVIKAAREVAAAFKQPEIDIEHLLIAIVRHEDSEVESILAQLGKSAAFVEGITEEYLKEQPARKSARDNLTLSPPTIEVLEKALPEKEKLYDPLVEPQHILIAIFDPKSQLSSYVKEKTGITKEDIYRAIAEDKSVEEIATRTGEPSGGKPEEGRKEIAGTLKYCIDMTHQASAGEFDPMIGREKELQQVIQILLRRRKNSPVLVGGAGVGKSAIVEGFAQAVIDGDVPRTLEGVKVMSVDMGAMVAGAKYKGEFEERFKGLISEVVKSAGSIILFVDEIHSLAGAGSGGGMDAANLIKPALARGQIRLIGATTEEEYTKYLEKDKALDRRFERVKVDEPTVDESVRIIEGVVSKYEEHHKIKFTREALEGAAKYARRYLSERNLPDVALDLIDEAASEYSVKDEFGKRRVKEIDERKAEVEKQIGVCEGKNPNEDSEEFDKLQVMYDEFDRAFEILSGYWGHRLDSEQEAEA